MTDSHDAGRPDLKALIAGASRAFRLQRGLSLAKLAELTGMSQEDISEIESGARRASPSELYELAIALDQPVGAFFDATVRMNGRFAIN